MAEGFYVPVIPRAKTSGISTPVGTDMAEMSRRRDQTVCDKSPKNHKAE